MARNRVEAHPEHAPPRNDRRQWYFASVRGRVHHVFCQPERARKLFRAGQSRETRPGVFKMTPAMTKLFWSIVNHPKEND